MEPTCPYCGSTNLSEPRCVVNEISRMQLEAMGIEVPMIQMCQACDATLDPKHFTGEVALPVNPKLEHFSDYQVGDRYRGE